MPRIILASNETFGAATLPVLFLICQVNGTLVPMAGFGFEPTRNSCGWRLPDSAHAKRAAAFRKAAAPTSLISSPQFYLLQAQCFSHADLSDTVQL
jgi:hypothetical protein